MWVSRYIVIMHIGRIVLGEKLKQIFSISHISLLFKKNIFFDEEILIFSIEQNFSFLKAKILKAKNVNKEEILIWQKVSVFTEKNVFSLFWNVLGLIYFAVEAFKRIFAVFIVVLHDYFVLLQHHGGFSLEKNSFQCF